MRLLSDSIEYFIKALMEDEQDQRLNFAATNWLNTSNARHPRSIMFWPRASRPIMVM